MKYWQSSDLKTSLRWKYIGGASLKMILPMVAEEKEKERGETNKQTKLIRLTDYLNFTHSIVLLYFRTCRLKYLFLLDWLSMKIISCKQKLHLMMQARQRGRLEDYIIIYNDIWSFCPCTNPSAVNFINLRSSWVMMNHIRLQMTPFLLDSNPPTLKKFTVSNSASN